MNAFVVVLCGFRLLLFHIFAAVKNKIYQWTDVAQSAGGEQLDDHAEHRGFDSELELMYYLLETK